MVSVGIKKIGKTPTHFVTHDMKVNRDFYCNQLLANILPEMEDLSEGDYILMYDGACSQTSTFSL